MSRGSSPTSSVRTTRGGLDATSTTLTLSERWFTTQTSVSLRAATATGSRPTGTDAACVRLPSAATAKISSRLSGVFTAKSRVAVRRQRERAHRAALERDEVRARGRRRRESETKTPRQDEHSSWVPHRQPGIMP